MHLAGAVPLALNIIILVELHVLAADLTKERVDDRGRGGGCGRGSRVRTLASWFCADSDFGWLVAVGRKAGFLVGLRARFLLCAFYFTVQLKLVLDGIVLVVVGLLLRAMIMIPQRSDDFARQIEACLSSNHSDRVESEMVSQQQKRMNKHPACLIHGRVFADQTTSPMPMRLQQTRVVRVKKAVNQITHQVRHQHFAHLFPPLPAICSVQQPNQSSASVDAEADSYVALR